MMEFKNPPANFFGQQSNSYQKPNMKSISYRTASVTDRSSTSFVKEAAESWSQKFREINTSKFGCTLQYLVEEVEVEDKHQLLCLSA
ncbi:hypothetical protein ANCCAN_20819 [Ancylostoma caninum]|uniref:Uncharacterized protein n=1 Tax=Ancylostoma caninum TaxID=29170 RepID=A0A368FM83_ANCCA|nr:hypothetical protein ANCCAN_20819 [Ancylostoma caninum]